IARNLRENQATGLPRHDLAIDTEHRSTFNSEHVGFDDLFGAELLVVTSDLDLLPDVLFEELIGSEQVVAIVLFKNCEKIVPVEALQVNGLRLNVGGDVSEG